MSHTRSILAGAGLVGSLLAPSSALACGGFFCSNVPMDQSKERIIFGIDPVEGKVEVHVQIFFQGEAEKFAWVVPVPDVPDVGLGSDALFQQLEWQTRPYFNLDWEERGTCNYDGGFGLYPGAEYEDALGGDADGGTGGGGGVEVLAEGQTGPFDWKVVSATTQQALLTWLKDPNGDGDRSDAYDVPEDIGPILGTYLADGAKFVAFRLTSDSDAGDILPIKLTYDGDRAMIPLVLTSIAATPDMRLQPYVFSNKRAVPDNYLHVRINEAKVNWLTNGSNYDDVVTLAANEAGGQAFATDYYGPTASFRDQLYTEGRFDLPLLRSTTAPADFVNQLLWQGFPRNAQMQNLIQAHIEMPQEAIDAGIDARSYYNCLSCYPQYTSLISFDPLAFVDDLDELVVTPMAEAEQLFHRFSKLTRMTSSMSPEEMTIDPSFVLNADMAAPVDNQHRASLVIDCGDGGNYSESPRWIELADGRMVEVPPDSWFWDNGVGYDEWLAGADQPAAEVIEQTGATGQPVPVSDRGADIDQALGDYNDWVRGLTGRGTGDEATVAACGCDQGRGPGGSLPLLAGLVGLLGLRRRR